MKLHANATTCPNSRALIASRVLDENWSLAAAAAAAGVSEPNARKWVGRFRERGRAGLGDRSSAPRRIPHRTTAQRVQAIVALRRLRMTAAEIAEALEMALSTVSRWLKRVGLGKRSRLDPPEPPNRPRRADRNTRRTTAKFDLPPHAGRPRRYPRSTVEAPGMNLPRVPARKARRSQRTLNMTAFLPTLLPAWVHFRRNFRPLPCSPGLTWASETRRFLQD
jgi:transposase